MAARRTNPNLVKLHRTYAISELAALLGVHKHTVRNWQREGLAPIDRRRPILFHGATVREFIKERNRRRKRPCRPGTMFCFGCREPRAPALRMLDFIETKAGSGNLKALCEKCERLMHRRCRKADLPAVMPGMSVKITQASQRLSGSPAAPLNCDLNDQGARA